MFAVVLGFVVPTMLFSAVGKRTHNDIPQTQPTDEPTQITTTPYHTVEIPVLMEDKSVVNMDMDEYLAAVVLKEMPADFEIEALKAQAVVARTYALRRYTSGQKHSEGAVCTSASCCQGFCTEEQYLSAGGDQASVEKIKSAVAETHNQVLCYQGELIEATYFSCSGGMTEDAVAVWGSEVPYLQATESPGEEKATHYTDAMHFTVDEFLESIGGKGETGVKIGDITYTDGGGIATITINDKTHTGTSLRQLLGLRSTAFAVHVIGNSVVVTTKGFGHRVGMSQYGADAMAVRGSTYREILAHYYQGTQLVDYLSEIDNP